MEAAWRVPEVNSGRVPAPCGSRNLHDWNTSDFPLPSISLFFIETFFDRRKIYFSTTKKYQYLLKRKKKPIKVMSDWKQHETTTTNDDTQNSPRYCFVEC
jgi:hypothetical protein